ncbi:MAG: class I SAM-dependent methyltransferase [Acidimicrobiales bacterium]
MSNAGPDTRADPASAPPSAARPGHQPGREYFDVMADSAESHWWYRARRALFTELLEGVVPAGGTAIDVGCGTGETLTVLRTLGATRAAGTDLSADALASAATHGERAVTRALAEQLPFPDSCADVLVSADVLEHLDSDRVALEEYRRVLRPGGALLVTVPSYQWLWCHLDDRAGHRRRYRLGQLCDAVTGSGFEISRRSHYFSFLVPPAALLRKTPLGRLSPPTDEDASDGALVSGALMALSAAERRILRHRTIPVGLSQFVLATRRS